ncbi:uncharacterized protein LOC111637519 [Centruroides sculpturatus]|uniref:uncharacterized protein LOC111637519 n=1 Tax=Centruroides sculpturatus TaxID=218467 RepID=UPI000C6D0AD2|nr:uncharacterized protein LOC111637519 [Centruroides sculpturatus]
MHITKAYSTTPNPSLQILARKAPIDSYIRLQEKIWQLKWGNTIHVNNQQIHRQELERPVQFADIKHPASLKKLNFSRPDDADIQIFTDGSKTNSNVGSSYVVYRDNVETASGQFKLGAGCTAFQAEMYAIKMAIAWSDSNYTNTKVSIISDSQSSIALLNSQASHPISASIHDIINNSNNIYHVSWTRAHQGTLGNERADILAKTASEDDNLRICYNSPTIKTIKNMLWKDLLQQWQHDWNTLNHPITHKFIPNIELFLSNNWYKPCHRMSQFLTNHGRFQSYLARFIGAANSDCPLCGVDDSSDHYIFNCPMLDHERHFLRSSMEAHGYRWPNESHGILDNKDAYEALTRLISAYFYRTTVPGYK